MKMLKSSGGPTSGVSNRRCIICDSSAGLHDFAKVQHVHYLRCAECGLLFQSQLPKPENFERAYRGSAFKRIKRKLIAPFLKLPQSSGFESGMRRAQQIFSHVQKHLAAEEVSGGKTFLDVGCNKGFLLAAAIEYNCEVWGVEFVQELTVPLKNTYPELEDRIFSEKFSRLREKLPLAYFDVITLIDVVEHFEDPVADMKYLAQLLKPTGKMIIQTPDAGCDRAIKEIDGWGAMKADEHLYLFNRENFKTFCRSCGLEILEFDDPFEEADGNFVAVLSLLDCQKG
jgi:SAM-dependent methyltransferase